MLAETLRVGTGPAAVLLASPDIILAAGSVVARELYGIECPIVELDATSFEAVTACAGARLRVDASDEVAVIRAARQAPGHAEAPAAVVLRAVQFPSFVDELPITRDALEFAAPAIPGSGAPVTRRPSSCIRSRSPICCGAATIRTRWSRQASCTTSSRTRASAGELTERFGPRGRVGARRLRAVARRSYGERRARLREAVSQAQPDAVAIYAADKVAKLRELRIVIATTRDYVPDREQLEHYWASLELLEERARGPTRPPAAVRARGSWPRCRPSCPLAAMSATRTSRPSKPSRPQGLGRPGGLLRRALSSTVLLPDDRGIGHGAAR